MKKSNTVIKVGILAFFIAIQITYCVAQSSNTPPKSLPSELSSSVAKCSETTGDVERLVCYDELAKATGNQSPAIIKANKGDWYVEISTSKINDKQNVSLSLASIDEIPGRFGGSDRARMAILCREGKTDIYFTFANHFLSDIQDYGKLTMRIDRNQAKKLNAQVSTDNSAIGLWSGAGVSLIKSLFAGQKLLVRVTPFNESSLTVEFKTMGLEQAIAPLRRACKW